MFIPSVTSPPTRGSNDIHECKEQVCHNARIIALQRVMSGYSGSDPPLEVGDEMLDAVHDMLMDGADSKNARIEREIIAGNRVKLTVSGYGYTAGGGLYCYIGQDRWNRLRVFFKLM